MSSNPDSKRTRDFGFLTLLCLVGLVVTWLLLMPWVEAITRTTMRRFHLQCDSFAKFAIQFPVPAMYNFANTVQVTEMSPEWRETLLGDPLFGDSMLEELGETGKSRYVNHFPARRITFSDARYEHLQSGQDRWFTLRSSYRGQHMTSTYHLKPRDQGGYEMVRVKP